MAIAAALYEHLQGTEGVDGRVFPVGEVPQRVATDGRAYIVYQRISHVPERHQTTNANLVMTRFQVDCWGTGYKAVQHTAAAVRERLDMFRGVMGSGRAVRVERATLDDDTDEYDEPDSGQEQGYHRVRMDFLVWHRE